MSSLHQVLLKTDECRVGGGRKGEDRCASGKACFTLAPKLGLLIFIPYDMICNNF